MLVSMGATGILGLAWAVCAQVPLELLYSRLLHAYRTQTAIFKELSYRLDEDRAADRKYKKYWL